MKWFKHYSSAHTDNSLKKVIMKYGAEGYAIYWYCLELITGDLGSDGKGVTFELNHDSEVIAYDLKIDTLKVEEIMRYMVNLGLFEKSENTITCLKIAKFLDKNCTRNKDIHNIIDSAKRIKKSNDCLNTVSRQSSDCLLPDKIRIDKNRKEIKKEKKTTVKIAHLIPSDFQPSDRCKELIQSKNIPMSFAVGLIPDFVFYWTEQSEKRKSWDTTFLNHVKSRFEYFQRDKKPFVSEGEVFNYD